MKGFGFMRWLGLIGDGLGVGIEVWVSGDGWFRGRWNGTMM